ncbi:MAG: beta-galactosidase, partial [Armatimonadota bacterium]
NAQVEGTSPQEKDAELRASLAKLHDAIIIANVDMDVLPVEAQYKILRQVADGAGLLMCYRHKLNIDPFRRPLAETRDFISQGVPWSGLPYFTGPALEKLKVGALPGLPERLVKTYAFHRGRIALLDYGETFSTVYGGPGLTPRVRASLDFPTEYDYYMSLVIKALLWAVPEKMPRLRIAQMPPDGKVVAREQMPRRETVSVLGDAGVNLQATLWHRLRNLRGEVADESRQPLRVNGGQASAVVTIPPLPAGTWFLDVIVRSEDGVECWGSTAFNVRGPVDIRDLTTDKGSYERGERAVVLADLTNPTPAEATFLVEIIDTAGRVFARAETRVPKGATSARAEVPLEHVLTLAARAKGALRIGQEVVAQAETVFYVPKRTIEELPSIIWGTNDNGLVYYQWLELRRAGFNTMLAHPASGGANFKAMALADLMAVVYSYRICGGADSNGVRKACFGASVGDDSFDNPAYREAAKDLLMKRLQGVPAVGPLVYSLGDENNFSYNSGFSPHDVAAFREFLKGQYQDVEALNESWGSNFASWEDVVPLPHKQAIERRQYAAVHDHYSFLEYQYAEFHRTMRRWIRELDPQAKVGAEGSQPGDLEESIRGLDLWSPYSRARDDVLLASIAPPTLLRGNWWGGYVGSHGGRVKTPLLWEQLLRGLNSNWWFATDGCEGLTQAGFGFAPYFEAQLPQFKEIYGGIGQLLATAEALDDGVALHYSMACEHASKFDARFGTTRATHTAFLAQLRRLGLNARYVTTRMMTQQEALANRPPKVLLLLHSQAISDAEAKAIQQYAEAGGTVIADIRCGVMDGHCKPVQKGALDDFFGVARTETAEPKPQRLVMARMGGIDVGLDAPAVTMDPSVRVHNAAVLAEIEGAPLFIGRKVGKGKAILLNFNLGQAVGGATDRMAALRFVQALLASAGVQPRFRVEPPDVWEVRALQSGELILVGLLRRGSGAAALVLPEAAEVYDTRAGKRLGRVGSISLSADDPRDVLIFSLQDVRTEMPTLSVTNASVGGVASGKVALTGAPGKRVIRLRVRDPGGEEVPVLRRYIRCDGQATFDIPIAFNDQPGKWLVAATDVATGVGREVAFRVKKGGRRR